MLFSGRYFSLPHILSILTFICILKISLTTQDPVPPLLVTRLIHHHSIYSPYFVPNRSISDLADIDLKSSISRASYLAGNATVYFYFKDSEFPLTPVENHGFLAYLQVGVENSIDQFVYIDTFSSLLWVNCEPIDVNVPTPLYNPFESSSYKNESCGNSRICVATGDVRVYCCDIYEGCIYEVQYNTRQFCKGPLAKETFKFGSTKEILRDIVFGCARRTNMYTNGVLGLAPNNLSLVAQSNSSKFAYCIGNISDRSYPYHTLVIGDQIKLSGYQTPLEDGYYLTLEGIKIGNVSLDFDRKIFRTTPCYTGGMMVDTSSTYSFIPQVVLKKFEEEVIKVMDLSLVRNHTIAYNDQYKRLCYNGDLNRDLKGFPTVQFQFQNDAAMDFTAENIFHQISDQSFCLAILPSEIMQATFSIMGNLMQQNFYIAYDFGQKKLSFLRMECERIDDYIHDGL